MYSPTADRDRRFETAGWGLLLLAIGATSLAPGLPEGSWLIAAGTVLLGITAARLAARLNPSGFTALMGAGALGLGAESVSGVDLPWLAGLLVICGVVLVLRAMRSPAPLATGAFAS